MAIREFEGQACMVSLLQITTTRLRAYALGLAGTGLASWEGREKKEHESCA